MFALTWEDCADGAISVTKSLMQDKQGYKSTKTGETRRVPCPGPLIAELDVWCNVQKAWFKEHGLKRGGKSPIVNSRVGNHVLQRTYIRWFKEAKCRYSLPSDFAFHGLRHTYVTLHNRDYHVDECAARSMSGYKTSQAFQIYTHTSSEWQRQAADGLGMLLSPDPDMQLCMNCRWWSASPVDATRGVCWGKSGEQVTVTASMAKFANGEFSNLAIA